MESEIDLLETDADKGPTVRIAVEGCGHGTLNNIYASVAAACRAKSWPGVDLLIIGGDFQAVRNSYDLNAMAVPDKYREIGDFHEYYSGKRIAPYLTLFIGGNHEASNYLTELYYGGWAAPKIYYMGQANVLKFGPLRIAGMSGIWKGYHYRKSHYERLPYREDDKKSVYHVRELDTRKLLQIRTQVDIGLSHDWPEGIQWCGDWKQLFKFKSHFEPDARSGRLGNIAAQQVLHRLRPRYWFSAHMHAKFIALVDHTGNPSKRDTGTQQTSDKTENADQIKADLDDLATSAAPVNGTANKVSMENSDEIHLDLDELSDQEVAEKKEEMNDGHTNPDQIEVDVEDGSSDAQQLLDNHAQADSTQISDNLRAQLPDSFRKPPPVEALPFPEGIKNTATRFLALNKCLPGRDFLQLLPIPGLLSTPEKSDRPLRFEYDKEWLAITRVFAKNLEFGRENAQVPRDEGEAVYRERILKEEAWVEENIVAKNQTAVPEDFELTAPVYDPSVGIHTRQRPVEYLNPQTARYCSLLQIDNPLEMSEEEKQRRHAETIRLQNEPPERNHRGGRGHFRGGKGGNRRGRGRGH